MSGQRAAGGLLAVLRVDGMTCSACSSTVERVLGGTAGVCTASVSCVTNLAHVEFDPKATSAEALVQCIEDVGFDATTLEVQEKRGEEKGQESPPVISVELKVEGMTCSACSGTIERHLQQLEGVDRAIVSLILNRAFVTCHPDRLSPESLEEEIESIGFDAKVELVSNSEASGGRASLHLQVTPLPSAVAKHDVSDYCLQCQRTPGVLNCHVSPAGHLRVVYDPHVLGARQLLQRLRKELAEEAEVEYVRVTSENEQLDGHLCEMRSLRWDLVRAVPPAATVFMLTIGLPSIGCDQDHMGILSLSLHHGVDIFAMVILCLATPVQFLVGRRFHTAAFRALKRRSPNMDVLVSVATNTAYFYSAGLIFYCLVSPETPGSHDISMATGHFFTMGPLLIAVVLLGKFLEARAKLSAIRAMTDLPDSMPSSAILCNGSGESSVPVELVELSDILRVFPGAKVPVDGVVCSEAPVHMDESLLTGESTAVPKKQGDIVMGGTTCVSGGCLMRVTKVGGDTALGQMCRLVQEAQASKAGVQRIADRVARVFVPSVISLSVVTFSVWAVLVFCNIVKVPAGLHAGHAEGVAMPMAMDATDHDVEGSLKLLFAMKFGMAVLMVACPCAMGLATPMAVMVATGVAAKRGCLVKSAAALETSARLDAVVLDKTGTITEGAPSIQAAACIVGSIQALLEGAEREPWERAKKALQLPAEGTLLKPIGSSNLAPPRDVEACFWWLLGTLESASDHPVAKCILSVVQRMEGVPPIVAPSNFEYLSGRGVRCAIEQLGGVTARVGNLRFFEETEQADGVQQRDQDTAELLQWVTSLQQQGHTVVVLHADARLLGAVALRDPVRKDAEWVVGYLKQQLGLEVWLCSGDNTATAQCIAQEVGISHVVAEALPLTKSECVQKLQTKRSQSGNFRVCFVGDGINDAPALAQADVGVAIGVGAQIAVEAADVALVRSELSDCVMFLALSRATFRTVMWNFFWAFCFNVVTLPMAAGLLYPRVHIPPLIAGIGMASSSCLVVVSSLQLRRFKPPEQGSRKGGYWRLASSSEISPLARTCPDSGESDAQVIGNVLQEP